MKKLFLLLAAGVLLISATPASAVGYANPLNAPSHQGSLVKRFFRPQPLPAFQAAPWYLYFPYNSHFQMAAPPMDEQGPGGYGGGYGNPYFPNQYAPRR
jgi:hypothetical protein